MGERLMHPPGLRFRARLRGGGRERIAVVLDLENLASEHRKAGDWSGAARALGVLLNRLSRRGDLVMSVALCDRRLARDLGPKLERFGIITQQHVGGTDEADRRLIELLRALPDQCSTVIIGSGDRIFAEQAQRLRANGRRVEAVARPGTISAELYRCVDGFHEFPPKT